MSELVRSAEVIAAEIRSIDAQTREIVLRSAIEIGNRLNEAKELVAHGEWGAWLEANVQYSQSTANNFMRIAEEYGSNFQAIENLTYTKALALLGVPADEREQFAQENDVDNMSARELQQTIKEKKQLEKELRKIQQAAEKERKEREALAEQVAKLQTELADAKILGDAEEAQKLQEALHVAQEKVKQLEKDLKAQPIDVPVVVEVVPPDIEKELAELRKMAAQPGNETLVKFKVQFEGLGAHFRDLLATLAKIKTADPETHEKYKGAVLGLISKMSENVR
ncbi:hypothetical protein BP422_15680 [Brevibacillus formosus]|uniref:DUF3102 domain-containing protein n=1 Tax=Brevibacillus formosus TaxID=54913 RepID=A0A220MK03_9BACL|nr:DUF3102 domain-containing protein [Brevibacillus formosus]ASJ54880.1 hypothetical protein BP422_15680 [Brevibacillus formosus]